MYDQIAIELSPDVSIFIRGPSVAYYEARMRLATLQTQLHHAQHRLEELRASDPRNTTLSDIFGATVSEDGRIASANLDEQQRAASEEVCALQDEFCQAQAVIDVLLFDQAEREMRMTH